MEDLENVLNDNALDINISTKQHPEPDHNGHDHDDDDDTENVDDISSSAKSQRLTVSKSTVPSPFTLRPPTVLKPPPVLLQVNGQQKARKMQQKVIRRTFTPIPRRRPMRRRPVMPSLHLKAEEEAEEKQKSIRLSTVSAVGTRSLSRNHRGTHSQSHSQSDSERVVDIDIDATS